MLDKFLNVMPEKLFNELPLKKWIDHAIETMSGVTTLTLGSQLSVKCKGPWGQKCV
jgi:hypothetical protein